MINPNPNDVRAGVVYGNPGHQQIGTLVVPEVGDVEEGVQYGSPNERTGTFHVPLESEVIQLTGYGEGPGLGHPGFEFNGTFICP